jgi:hypothetical protein
MLSKEQIEYLFAFCRHHFVKYYEVQVELVDHLANAVELEIKKDPKLTFEKAVEKVHQSFGVMGFAPLVAEKQKMAEKQSWKLIWKLFKAQFKWPKIVTFFLLTALFYTLFSAEPSILKLVVFGIAIISWIADLICFRKLKRLATGSGKKFLIVDVSWFSSLILLPGYFVGYANFFEETHLLNYSPNNMMAISIMLTLYIIAIITTFQALSSIKQSLINNYPEVFCLAE